MSVVSKNLYDLLENDGGEGSAASKNVGRGGAQVDASKQGSRRGQSGNEAAYRDRGAGSASNRGKPTEDSARGAPRGGYNARVRGGRGSGHPRNRDDRHSKNTASGSEKQASQSWGATEGKAELKDEEAGEEMAQTEKKEDGEGGESKAAPEPTEPEEVQVAYSDYLVELAQKKLNMEEISIRQANEGSKVDKKWANAQPLVKNSDEVYFEGTAGKAKRERERKQKNILEIDSRYVEPERGGRGGSRGAGRGGGRGRGRGEFRGGREGGDFRGGRDGPRGDSGGRGGGYRGDGPPRYGGPPRGGRGGGAEGPPINTKDQSAFPSLGA